MPFDQKAFSRETFTARTEDVSVPELAKYYGDAEPLWTVRGLTGEELFKVRAASDRTATLAAMAESLAGGKKDVAAALKDLAGLGDGLPEDYTRRIEMVLLGSVEPVDRPTVVKLGQVYPVVLTRLADAIMQLTGLGQEPGKSNGSGASPASATP